MPGVPDTNSTDLTLAVPILVPVKDVPENVAAVIDCCAALYRSTRVPSMKSHEPTNSLTVT